MKRILLSFIILLFSTSLAWGGPSVSKVIGQAYDADLSTLAALASITNIVALAGLTPTDQAVIGWNGTTMTAFTTHSHSDSAGQFFNVTNPTRLIKMDASGISADSKTFSIKPITDVDATFSPGKTFTDGKWCSYATATGLTCNETPGEGTGDLLANGSVPWTAAPVPNAANTIALGSASAEWADIYLGDGAVIHLGNDQDVTITHVADSGVTLAANSEDLQLAATANTWTLSSSTGVTDLSLGAIHLASTGQVTGRVHVATTAINKTLSGKDLYGSMQMTTVAVTLTLPDIDAAAGTGQSFCTYATGAHVVTIDPDAEDKIRLNGVLGAAGASIDNNTAEAAGDFICLMVTDFDGDIAHWTTLGYKGTWAVTP